MKAFASSSVAAAFAAYPRNIRKRLLFLRQLVFSTAAATDGVGVIEETLKWGQPAYLTRESRTGSTIRIDCRKADPQTYAMYFHCQTDLIHRFRTLFPKTFAFEGNRAIVFHEDEAVPVRELEVCIAAALTYRRTRNIGSAARKNG